MNVICQDRALTTSTLSCARIDPQSPPTAHNSNPLANAGLGLHRHSQVLTEKQKQVGKTFANWNHFFANWIQLADPCQLHFHINQVLTHNFSKLAVGRWQVLPTDRKPAWILGFYQKLSWRKYPYLSEIGRQTPLTRFCQPTNLGSAFFGLAGVSS